MGDGRRGVLFGVGAYTIWGLFPLYWPLLEPAGSGEILAHRCLWSLVAVALVLTLRRQWSWVRPMIADRRRLRLLAIAAVLIALNWGVYIYGVNSHHVVETALGYFINPLITVLLGVFVLHERLEVTGWIAVGLAACAVAVLTVELRAAALHRADPGVLLRRLRLPEEPHRRTRVRRPDRRDDRAGVPGSDLRRSSWRSRARERSGTRPVTARCSPVRASSPQFRSCSSEPQPPASR